jgi:hypothetical protein
MIALQFLIIIVCLNVKKSDQEYQKGTEFLMIHPDQDLANIAILIQGIFHKENMLFTSQEINKFMFKIRDSWGQQLNWLQFQKSSIQIVSSEKKLYSNNQLILQETYLVKKEENIMLKKVLSNSNQKLWNLGIWD